MTNIRMAESLHSAAAHGNEEPPSEEGEEAVEKGSVQIAPSFVFLASAEARYYSGDVLAPAGSEMSR